MNVQTVSFVPASDLFGDCEDLANALCESINVTWGDAELTLINAATFRDALESLLGDEDVPTDQYDAVKDRLDKLPPGVLIDMEGGGPTPETPYGVSPSREGWVRLHTGNVVAFDGVDRNGTSYVRVLDPNGGELGYWTSTEWEEEPESVMGAFCGAMLSTEAADPEKFYQFGPDSQFPNGIQ
jgi:hypothetical protein